MGTTTQYYPTIWSICVSHISVLI